MDTLLPRDLALWQDARRWLDVRSNDVHTLIAYGLGRALLDLHRDAEEAVVLPAILLHDVGWKMFPQHKLTQAVGPHPKYPELQREHEVESARIAREILVRHAPTNVDIDAVIDIIDGHDTRPEPLSESDALMKDADKLWRFTVHGVETIGGWFDSGQSETLGMLEDFVLPKLLTKSARGMATGFLAAGRAHAQADHYLDNLKNV